MKKLIATALGAATLAALAVAPTAAADTSTVALFTYMVQAEAKKYGTGPIPVYVEYITDSTTIAQTDNNGITLNASWARMSPAEFNARIAEDVRVGFTPGGCAGIQATAIHEFGHVLDRRGGRAALQAVAASSNRIGRDDLHSYAFDGEKLSPGEAVAISFQAVECGSATPVEQAIYKVLVS